MVKQGHWEDEIVKRIADNFNNQYYTDVVWPIAFDGVWVLMTFNYERRQVQIVYFQKETGKFDLRLLHQAADFMWREGGRMGLRC